MKKNSPLKILFFFLCLFSLWKVQAQKIEDIYVHLYTDSLKKNTYNYINIDGKLSNGRFLPLDSTQIIFKSSGGLFKGNDLYIPADYNKEFVTIYVFLRADTSVYKKFKVYIKTAEDPPLKTEEEILRDMKSRRSRKRS